MNRTMVLGLGLTLVGLAGYIVGVSVEYPGRAFSLTALITGLTLVAVFRGGEHP